MSTPSYKTSMINVNEIRVSEGALRKPDVTTAEFAEFREDIRANGLIQPIAVRRYTDPAGGVLKFELIDGAHRFAAVCEIGWETIPAIIKDVTSKEALFLQISANEHRRATRPAELASALNRELTIDPTLSLEILAQKLHKPIEWLNKIYSLHKITNERIRSLIDSNKISLSNAIELLRLPTDSDRAEYIEAAMTQTSTDFKIAVTEGLKQIRKARAGNVEEKPDVFVPQPKLRKLEEVKSVDVVAIASAAQSKEEAARAAIDFVLSLDQKTVAAAQADWEARKKEAADKAEKAAKARAEKLVAKRQADLEEAKRAELAVKGE